MKLENSITGEVVEIDDEYEAQNWIQSTSPWQKLSSETISASSDEAFDEDSLLGQIFEWTSGKLPLWQRDAVRRLFKQDNGLSSTDYDQLYLLLKHEQGISVESPPQAVPLTKSDLPATSRVGEKVLIRSVRDLSNVNRLAEGQKLEFAGNGMSTIYGGNGAGKSGYVRVLKKVCRARGAPELVRPDANDPESHKHVPEALFDIDVNSVSKQVKWLDSSEPPEDLAKISVFDSRCARAYLTEEQDVAFLPYGLDVIEDLANKVIPEISHRLTTELASISVDKSSFMHLEGETKVGKTISSLSAKTDTKSLVKLAAVSEDEINRLIELDAALADSDPATKAEEFRMSADRIKALVGRIDKSFSWVSEDGVKKLNDLLMSADAAGKAEIAAAGSLRSGEDLLPGTGDIVWKSMYEAARNFVKEAAYPECDYPHFENDQLCPLCQQNVGPAVDRLARFEKFIQDDVAKEAEQARKKLETAQGKIERANLDFGFDTALSNEIDQLDGNLKSVISEYSACISSRHDWMQKQNSGFELSNMPGLSLSPRAALRKLAAKQLQACRTYLKAIDKDKKEKLSKERDELKSREQLSVCAESVVDLVERIKKKEKLSRCSNYLKTRPISDKSKELSSTAVTLELKKALDEEFSDLGIGHIKTKLKDRNQKGKVKHQLLLDLPAASDLGEILSEGEQRAIALGAFLAELKLSDHACGIVFDDPVSSLDHRRRRKLARRLVKESAIRQVIVFTHDVVFLTQLRDETEKQGLSIEFSFLEPNGGYYGNVVKGLPWVHKSYKERIDTLEKKQREFDRLPWPADPNEELSQDMIRQYSFLRATIERVIQDFILGGTVQRFNEYINVSRLERVVGLESDEVTELLRINQRCNEVVEAHDPSSIDDEPAPTAAELKMDIDALKELIARVESRRKAA
ncbi:AAA family ATPase [Pseudoteredinibacter isoporae]|uniref:AAA family ATPase n=1 Tax=Pseudoteredinibacter isoporae TaxID=570281 RepID=UPI0031059ECB